ncbi:diacylglycerol kinase family protein [Erythrobacter sp.]|uniref:diacylglycerol/lipid kinase family protein n=1 Tax=Erythrobacter sp. TaxID=1042 RepID=UPI0025FB50C6|nr:diacylglycerol kinase family protein [Erythrobacter sp.]
MNRKPDSACWLVVNPASGSNEAASAETLAAALQKRGWSVSRTITFPDQPLPTPAALDAAAIAMVVVYAGDGTVNALINGLAGWGGAVLVLPGGTMNLLAKRLHRSLDMDDIFDIVAGGGARRCRPACVRCDGRLALAGLLVGPGTQWNRVRESMRDFALADMAAETIEAIRHTATAPYVLVPESGMAREDGYPLIELTPGEHGIQIDGYYAEDPLDYAGQAWALLRRRFREGPHDRLGMVEALVLSSIDGSPLACLIDGEPAECPSPFRFTVEPCAVDLLASAHDL